MPKIDRSDVLIVMGTVCVLIGLAFIAWPLPVVAIGALAVVLGIRNG